ncbi:Uncharacterised protein [Vibrio cholerae]|nr:Uncharacterised protein [Vibrio cholerae]CSB64740.1 Uncharacterised protein [Vibrio cholerae]CSC16586.1 Uncharacterised protein [Vibrio cholerae]CSC97451.1 Uncharacterised protein [Vibrio cholerae]CSI24982.1 Uncharacterised protein [Vibrio cholerae]
MLGFFRYFLGQSRYLLLNFCGPFMGNLVSTNRNLRFHTRGHVFTQHFNDFTHHAAVTRATVGNFNHDHVAHASAGT